MRYVVGGTGYGDDGYAPGAERELSPDAGKE